MKRIIIIAVSLILLAGVIGTGTVVLAKSESGASQNIVQTNLTKGQILRRLLLIQDGSKVDALLAQAQSSGKLTQAQVTKIKTFWTANHVKAANLVKAVIANRIVSVKSEANLRAFLDKQVTANKLTGGQESKIINYWESNHQK